MATHSNHLDKIRFVTKELRGFRSYDPRLRRSRLAGPISVELQTIDRCNAACIMCPYSGIAHPGPARPMDDALYSRILEQMVSCGTVKTVCLMLQNEPLLDRRLAERVREAKEALGPATRVITVTHGALLTSSRVDELVGAGVNRISVSIDTLRRKTYERIRPGLDFDQVVANTHALIRRGDVEVVVKFVLQRDNEGEEREFARYWRSRGAAVSIDRLTNRAGLLDEFERLRVPRPGTARRLLERILNRLIPCCPLPFTSASILGDGRVLTCSHDWGPRDPLGDLSTSTLAEVWNGEKANHYRHLLHSRRSTESRICRDCSLAPGFWSWSPPSG